MILCFDPNCEHLPASAINTDPACRAALFYDRTNIAYYEGNIYYFVNDGVFAHKIYRMAVTGSGRELLAELPFSYNIGHGVVFDGDMMYYVAEIPHKDEVLTIATYTSRLLEYNLKDNTYRFITEETDDVISLMHLAGNYIYMKKSDYSEDGILYLSRVNIKNCVEEIVIPGTVSRDEYCHVGAYDDDSYFYYDKKKNEIGIRTTDNSHIKVLVEGCGKIADASSSGNWLFYICEPESESVKTERYIMNVFTGEVYDITEAGSKYGIVAFDAYYDAFITRQYNEEENDMDWGMLSREKVFAEVQDDQT